MFWKKNTSRKIGLELSKRVRKSVENICCIQPSIENIDCQRVVAESTILIFVGCRLALHAVSTTNEKENRMREICEVFDSYCFEFLPNSSEFRDLLDQRGGRYFQLLQSHNDEIRSDGNWDGLLQDLGCRFDQFCRGGGGKNEPLIIGDFFTSMAPLMSLASRCWSEGFVETVKYVENR